MTIGTALTNIISDCMGTAGDPPPENYDACAYAHRIAEYLRDHTDIDVSDYAWDDYTDDFFVDPWNGQNVLEYVKPIEP